MEIAGADTGESFATLLSQPIEPPLGLRHRVFESAVAVSHARLKRRLPELVIRLSAIRRVYRMDEDVPLLIAEINHDHVGLIEKQKANRGFTKGFIVTNPNCAVVSFAPPLAALHRKFGVESVMLTTISGDLGCRLSGRGVARYHGQCYSVYRRRRAKGRDRGAEDPRRPLPNGVIEKADFTVSAQCFRVNVIDGHMVSVRVNLKDRRDARRRGRRDARISVARSAFVAEAFYRGDRRTFASANAARPRQRQRHDDHRRPRFPGQYF